MLIVLHCVSQLVYIEYKSLRGARHLWIHMVVYNT
jgi:hypothetical protein